MADKIIREDDTKARIELLTKRIILNNTPTPKGNTDSIALGVLNDHLDTSRTSIVAAKIILESNPALERSLDILAGLIANPDGSNGSSFLISAKVPEVVGVKIKPKDVNSVTDFIGDYVNNTLRLRRDLESIVKEILGVRGAHVELYIPDGVNESLREDLGNESLPTAAFTKIMENKKVSKKEGSVWSNGDIDFTADWQTFLPKLIKDEQFTKAGNEADKSRGISLSRILRNRKFAAQTPLVSLNKDDVSLSRLKTLTKDVAAEAVHPICRGGDPDDVFGYIFLLDEHNGFVRIDDNIDFDESLRRSGNDEGKGNKVLGKIASSFGLESSYQVGSSGNYSNARNLFKAFTDKIETEMVDTLITGQYIDNYTLGDDNFLSEIMFWRLLKEKKTRVLFVPESLVSYIAFYKNAAGVGQSILTKAKLLSRLYTVLFYADYMSYLDEAIPRTEVTVTMDEADTDQRKTREMVLAERAMSRTNILRVSPGDPAGAVDALSRQSTTVKVIGNGMDSNTPNMEITEERVT
jgi:hypothetical protein